jgi:hypothetical protein
MSKIILGVMVKRRVDEAVNFQELLSEYGCYISTRIGLHATGENYCSPDGIVLLEVINGYEDKAAELESKLKELDVILQKMVF